MKLLSFLKNKSLFHKLILLNIFILLLTLVIRLVDQSQLLFAFPGGYINDLSSYLAQLFFLDACGFHAACSYWYNGFTAFLISPPGWYFFTYPFYLLAGDVKVATYISFILIYFLAFVVIYLYGKRQHIRTSYLILFFLLIFANANSLRGLLRSGRPHELLAWLFFLILFFMLLRYYRKPFDTYVYLVALPFAALIITYFSVAVFGGILFLSLFLVKQHKEQLQLIAVAFLGILFSSFWLIPFLLYAPGTFLINALQNSWLLTFSSATLLKQLGAFIFPLAFVVLFICTYRQSSHKKPLLLFYSPFLVLAGLLFFRLTPFIPILQNIGPNPYFTLFTLLAAYLFITLPKKHMFPLFSLALTFFIIVSSILTLFFTPYFTPQTQDAQDLAELLPFVEERYILLGITPKQVYTKPFSSYAAIYANVTYTRGWYPHVKDQSYFTHVDVLKHSFLEQNCAIFTEKLAYLNTTEVISHTGCSFLAQCGLSLKQEHKGYCLYTALS